jgi:hypothetical protein
MPVDDESLRGPEVELVRALVHPAWLARRDDGSERPSSGAFVESTNQASCFILAETDLKQIAARFPGKKLAVVTAAAVRDAGFIIARDDEGGDGIPGHVILIQQSARPESKGHVRLARQLANTARIIDVALPAPTKDEPPR